MLKVGVDSRNSHSTAVPAGEGRISSTVRFQMQHQTAEVWNIKHEEAPAWEFAVEQVWDGDSVASEERDTEMQGEGERERE